MQLLSHSVEDWKTKVQIEPTLYYGIVKLMEIIGEAAYKLTKEFKASRPEIKWRAVEVMRHFLVHEYYQIKTEDVWATLTDDIAPLLTKIEEYLSTIEPEGKC